MRNMLMVGAASFALLGATQAMAQSSIATLNIDPVCGVSGLSDFATTITDKANATSTTFSSSPFTVFCDATNVVDVKVESANGGLQGGLSSSPETISTLIALNAETPAGLTGGSSTVSSPGASFTQGQTPSVPLAGGVGASLSVTPQVNPTFSGAYVDTLTVTVSGS